MERIYLDIQRFGVTSGQCVTSTNSDGSYFYVNWQQVSQDIANNKTTINYQYGVHCGARYYSNAVRIDYVNINNSQVKGSETYSNFTRGDHELGSGSMDIYHNSDGSKTFNINLSGWTWRTTTVTGTTNFTLNNIPRYTSVTQWSVTSKTETSITLTWKTADVCSAIRYGIGNTSGNYTEVSVNSNTGSVTIDNLTANTDYTLYFMPKRKDSNLWGDGSANTWKTITQKTYSYPYASVMPNFNIESPVTLTIFNPLSKQCTVTVYDVNNNEIGSTTTNGTSAGQFLDDATSTLRMYSSIPNNPNGTYTVKVETEEPSSITTTGGLYIANPTLCSPTFEDFTIADVDEDTRYLTGNNRHQIVNYSDMAAIIYTQDKAVAQKGATMSKYRFIIGNSDPVEIPYSENLEVSEVIDNAPAGIFNVYAIDSRGNSTLVTKVPETVIEYTNILKGNISVSRQDNVGESVTLTFNGTFWNDTFGDVHNSITNVTYRFKKTTDQNWTTGVTSITPTTSGNNYSFTGGIAGDTAQLGFDAGSSYNIEVTVYDELSSTTFTTTLGSGTPNMAFYQDGVSFGGKYDESDYNNNKHQFYGNTKIVGNENVNGDVDITGNYKINGTPLSIPVLDTAVSTTSTNGVQNQAITNYVNSKHSDTGWLSVPKGSDVYDSSWNPLKYRKKDGIVTVVGTVDVRGASSWGRLLATLPAGARPVNEFDIICRTSTAPNNCQVAIATDGTIIFLTCGENWGQYSGDHSVFIAATFIAA